MVENSFLVILQDKFSNDTNLQGGWDQRSGLYSTIKTHYSPRAKQSRTCDNSNRSGNEIIPALIKRAKHNLAQVFQLGSRMTDAGDTTFSIHEYSSME